MATVAQKKEIVHVEHCKGIDGFDKVILREARGCSAEVYLYGGHVTYWKNEHGEELLFLSSKAKFVASKAIRGGIPICFPQISALKVPYCIRKLLQVHSVARQFISHVVGDGWLFYLLLAQFLEQLTVKSSYQISVGYDSRSRQCQA